jgi:hypothetical protein
MIRIAEIEQTFKDIFEEEYSVGNLLFKLLRRNVYVSKIMELKKYAYDKQFE